MIEKTGRFVMRNHRRMTVAPHVRDRIGGATMERWETLRDLMGRLVVSCLIILAIATAGGAQPGSIGPAGALSFSMPVTFTTSATFNGQANFNGTYGGSNPPLTGISPTITGTVAGGATYSGITLSGTTTLTGTLSGTGGPVVSSITCASGCGVTNPSGVGTATLSVTAILPTFTLKKGSGAGNYSDASGTHVCPTYVDLDATNLAYTVTVPSGQKVLIATEGSFQQNTGGTSQIALTDGTTLLAETGINMASNQFIPWSLNFIFVGDGASHTFKLRWCEASGTMTITMFNSSGTLTPMTTFYLGPAL